MCLSVCLSVRLSVCLSTSDRYLLPSIPIAPSGECLRSKVKSDMVRVDGSENCVIPLLSASISERFRDELHDEALYKLMFFTVLYFTSC